MKRFVVFLLIVFVTLPIFAEYTSDAYGHYIIGRVDTSTNFSVTLLNDVLPFDLTSTEVQYNPDFTTMIRGIRVGYYSLFSNSGNFELLIAHTPLVLTTERNINDTGILNKIDYRLYAVADYHNVKFLTCLSDENAINPADALNKIRVASDNENIWPDGATMCTIVNQSIYVSLEDDTSGNTASTVEDLIAGSYESAVYFLLRGR